jgi:NTP pyrophosphatase (non-canonical NTP hydrolase)
MEKTNYEPSAADVESFSKVLKYLQEKIVANKIAKGFNTENIPLEFNLLHGEVSEAFEAWAKSKEDLPGELADIHIYTLGLAGLLDVDLAEATIRKLRVNASRTYTVNKYGIGERRRSISSILNTPSDLMKTLEREGEKTKALVRYMSKVAKQSLVSKILTRSK